MATSEKRFKAWLSYSDRAAHGLCGTCGKRPNVILKTQCEECARKRSARATARCRKLKSDYAPLVWAHYGQRCACCGETEPAFLAIDHVNNDGNVHRKKVKPYMIWK